MDFSKYTYFELIDALEGIDKERYPERAEEIKKEIIYLQSRFPPAKTAQAYLDINRQPEKEGIFQKLFINLFRSGYRIVDSYGSIQAEIAPSSSDSYQEQPVSVDIVSKDEALKLKINGAYEWSDSYHEVSIILNHDGVERLGAIIQKYLQKTAVTESDTMKTTRR